MLLSYSGLVTTLAGGVTAGYLDGTGTVVQLNAPYGIAAYPSGGFYISDGLSNTIRLVTTSGLCVVQNLSSSSISTMLHSCRCCFLIFCLCSCLFKVW